jgi:tetratricopeptide (TPR) repeat protein
VSHGSIADQPLPLWLVGALDERLAGTLRLWSPGGEHRLHLRNGEPIGVESPTDIAPLSLMLVRQQAISAAKLMELDVDERDDPAALARVVEPTLLRRTMDLRGLLRANVLFTLRPETQVELSPLFDPLPRDSLVQINPLALITRGLRGLAGRVEPLELVKPLLGRELSLHPDAQVADLELLPFEMQIAEALLQGTNTYDELTQLRCVHARALSATLFIFHTLRFLVGASKPPVRRPEPEQDAHEGELPRQRPKLFSIDDEPTAPRDDEKTIARALIEEDTVARPMPRPPLPPEPAAPRPAEPGPSTEPVAAAVEAPPVSGRVEPARKGSPRRGLRPKELVAGAIPTQAELETRMREMDQETYFEVLKVLPTASAAEIRAGYAKQMFLYHPDRMPSELNALASRICARLGAAMQALGNDEVRERIRDEAELKNPTSPSAQQLARARRAAKLFDEAERLVRTGKHRQAERVLERAVADDENPSYLALLGWCQAEAMGLPPAPVGQVNRQYDGPLRLLQKALRSDPDDARARYYFAQVLQRSGRHDAALVQFKIVTKLQPHNIGAAREVRIAEMRQRNAENSAGLFKRFFTPKPKK